MSEVNIDQSKYPINAKLPTWNGSDGQVGLEAYSNVVQMDLAGRKEEEKARMGPQYWGNLRGEAFKAVAKMKPVELTPGADEHSQSGVYRLIERLKLRWPEGSIRKLPRLYRNFFKEIKFGGDMDQFLTSLTQAKDELEAADEHARISDGILGWAALELAGLTEQEQAHVLGLAGNSMRFSLIRPHLESLYSKGSYSFGRGAHAADVEAEQYGDELDYLDEEDAYWDEYEDDVQNADAENQLAATAAPEGEDEQNALTTVPECGDDHETQAHAWCEEAYMNFRQARAHLNGIRTSRKFST